MWRHRFFVYLLLAFLTPHVLLGQEGGERAASAYRIQPGDVLEISVWSEPDLLRTVLVAPDGAISFPLAGEIVARGKLVSELREEISDRLTQYLTDPLVTVTLTEVLGNKVYVLGHVASPGAYVVNPHVDVMQALSMAGGATPYAALKDIKILRRQGGKQVVVDFRYDDVASGRNLDQNIVLASGDIVVVP